MRRFVNAAFVVGAMLLTTATAALASSHRAMPAGMSFGDQIAWEIQHYLIHMQLTFEAIRIWLVSPELGWALLGDQTICATLSPLVGVLFSSALGALVTFVATIVFGVMLFAWLALQLWRIIHMPRWQNAQLAA